jgi:hypothetical protein
VAPNMNHRCMMTWTDQWTLNCHFTDRAL